MTGPDIVGLIGVTILIVTYAMLQFDRIDPKGFWYSFNNMIVAVLVTVSLLYSFNLASMVIEVFWFGLSVYGIWNFYRKRK
tara:strand:+ start:5603 stop:5845 length:243 start_codon:yes stop_codon:yes gene_type:complete